MELGLIKSRFHCSHFVFAAQFETRKNHASKTGFNHDRFMLDGLRFS